MLETTEKTGKKKHDKNEREDWRTVGELQPSFLHTTSPVTPCICFSCYMIALWFANFLFKKYQVQATWIQTDLFWCCGTSFFTLIPCPYALRLLSFALFPHLSPWQPWQLGTNRAISVGRRTQKEEEDEQLLDIPGSSNALFSPNYNPYPNPNPNPNLTKIPLP